MCSRRGIFLPETPNSLIERGHFERAKRVLQKVCLSELQPAESCDCNQLSLQSAAPDCSHLLPSLHCLLQARETQPVLRITAAK